jgi:hypothetical protein
MRRILTMITCAERFDEWPKLHACPKNPRMIHLYPFSKINQDIPIVMERENPFALCSQFLAHSRSRHVGGI